MADPGISKPRGGGGPDEAHVEFLGFGDRFDDLHIYPISFCSESRGN